MSIAVDCIVMMNFRRYARSESIIQFRFSNIQHRSRPDHRWSIAPCAVVGIMKAERPRSIVSSTEG